MRNKLISWFGSTKYKLEKKKKIVHVRLIAKHNNQLLLWRWIVLNFIRHRGNFGKPASLLKHLLHSWSTTTERKRETQKHFLFYFFFLSVELYCKCVPVFLKGYGMPIKKKIPGIRDQVGHQEAIISNRLSFHETLLNLMHWSFRRYIPLDQPSAYVACWRPRPSMRRKRQNLIEWQILSSRHQPVVISFSHNRN